MRTKDKFFALMKEGFKLKTLKKMNESQINVLYKKLVNEQDAPVDKTETIKTNLIQANQLVDKLSAELGEEELNEWGSSDQNIMNASIHRDLGEPEEMPSPFSRELESAVEDAVDFYWDDWEEYETDRESLIDDAKRRYLRSYFREKFNALVKMFEPIPDIPDYNVDIDGELYELDIDNINPFKGRQTQSPKQVGPSTDDGMDNYQDGMGIFEGKKKPTKMKTPITTLGMFEEDNEYAICMDSIQDKHGPKKTWSKSVTKKFDSCVAKVGKDLKERKDKVRQIEESIVSLLKNYKKPTMTKKDLLEQGTKEAPVKTPTKTPSKPERKTPYKPKHKPAPKAGDTKTAPTRTKPGTKERPDRKTPYKPKHKPAPKAGTDIPDFLTFDNLNITFRDE